MLNCLLMRIRAEDMACYEADSEARIDCLEIPTVQTRGYSGKPTTMW